MSRQFDNIGKLIAASRIIARISQGELSTELGYKNGQFISNVERGLCSIPHKKILKTAEILKIPAELIIQAVIADYTNKVHDCVIIERTPIAPATIPGDNFGVNRG